MSKVERLRR